MRAEEYEGYCCLAIAILCNVNASEAQNVERHFLIAGDDAVASN